MVDVAAVHHRLSATRISRPHAARAAAATAAGRDLRAPAYSFSACLSGTCCASRARRELRRIRREERERRLFVDAVLGKIEMDAADEIPCGAAALEKRLERFARFGELGVKRRVELVPQRFEHIGGDILRAAHRRDGGCKRRQLFRRRRRNACRSAILLDARVHAHRAHVACGEVAPVAQVRRKWRGDLVGAEAQEAVPRAARECVLQFRRELRIERRRVVRRSEMQMAARSEDGGRGSSCG